MNMRMMIASAFLIVSSIACAASDIKITQGKFDRFDRSDIANKITVDVNKAIGTVDKKFYGSHIDSFSSIPEKAFIDELKLGMLRIGGNEYDVFNWKNKFTMTKNGLTSIHGFEDIALRLQKYSVEGIFQVNMLGFQPELEGGSLVLKKTFTADSAYELVKYLNGNLKLGIVNFSLGNEFSIWHETHSHVFPDGDGISADEYIENYIHFALAIRKATEENSGNSNNIKIWGPEISSSWVDWNNGNFNTDCQWSWEVKGRVDCKFGEGKFNNFIPYFLYRIKQAETDKSINPRGYKLMDYFAFHYYPNFRTNIDDINSIILNAKGVQDVAKMLESTRVFNDATFVNTVDKSVYRNVTPNILGRFKSWINTYYPNAKIALNEFAIDSDYRTTNYHPVVRPLYLADLIGILTKENVAFLNYFVLSNAQGAKIPWSLIDGSQKTNQFMMYKLFTNNFLGSVVSVEDNMGDSVNAYATTQGNMINLALVNKTPNAKDFQVFVKDGNSKKLITEKVPGWSSMIIKFDKSPGLLGGKYDIYTYGADEMGVAKDPNYN